MSDSVEQIITSEEKPKEKDPKRVAAGKRLAAISKAAKEAKRIKQQQDAELDVKWWSPVFLIGLGILGCASYKYFFTKPEKVKDPPVEKKKQPNKENPRGKPVSLFD